MPYGWRGALCETGKDNDSANGPLSGLGRMAKALERRPPDRSVDQFRTHQLEHIPVSFRAKALL